MTEFEGWLTVQEAADLVGYHPERIRELVRDGKITSRKFGVAWAVNRESLLDYLEKMKQKGKKRGYQSRKGIDMQ